VFIATHDANGNKVNNVRRTGVYHTSSVSGDEINIGSWQTVTIDADVFWDEALRPNQLIYFFTEGSSSDVTRNMVPLIVYIANVHIVDGTVPAAANSATPYDFSNPAVINLFTQSDGNTFSFFYSPSVTDSVGVSNAAIGAFHGNSGWPRFNFNTTTRDEMLSLIDSNSFTTLTIKVYIPNGAVLDGSRLPLAATTRTLWLGPLNSSGKSVDVPMGEWTDIVFNDGGQGSAAVSLRDVIADARDFTFNNSTPAGAWGVSYYIAGFTFS